MKDQGVAELISLGKKHLNVDPSSSFAPLQICATRLGETQFSDKPKYHTKLVSDIPFCPSKSQQIQL